MIMNAEQQLRDAIRFFGAMTHEQLVEKMLLRYPNDKHEIEDVIFNAVISGRIVRKKQLDGSILYANF
jgi:hypothetical protein